MFVFVESTIFMVDVLQLNVNPVVVAKFQAVFGVFENVHVHDPIFIVRVVDTFDQKYPRLKLWLFELSTPPPNESCPPHEKSSWKSIIDHTYDPALLLIEKAPVVIVFPFDVMYA